MSDIEAEIRRQMLEERQRAQRSQAALSPAEPVSVPNTPPTPGSADARSATGASKKGLIGILGGLGVVLAKSWAVVLSVLLKLKVLLVGLKFLTFSKLLLTGGTMLLSMLVYAWRFGWPFAVGLVLLIFIHESGHALAARSLGLPIGKMVFVPFMGAFVTTGRARNAVEDAYVGIMGPVAGTLGGLACYACYFVTGHPFWLVLAWFNFFMNLLNLTPAPPLDGGWIAPLFSPKLLLPVLILLFFTFRHNPMVWVLALLSLPRILFAWKHGKQSAYYQATARDRWIYGLAWGGLAAFLAMLDTVCHDQILALIPH